MKILVINPNSDREMTEVIRKASEGYAGDRFEVLCLENTSGPHFIDSYEDEITAAAGMKDIIQTYEDRVDGFVIACMDDPNLEAMKELTVKPVVGIAEASMKIASMLGHRFSIVSTSRQSIPNHEVLARAYHLEDMLASVRAPEDTADLEDEELFYIAARDAVQKDLAEVIVLGCAGLADMARRLEKRLNVPVLDGVICRLIVAFGLAHAGWSTSKAGRYRPRKT